MKKFLGELDGLWYIFGWCLLWSIPGMIVPSAVVFTVSYILMLICTTIIVLWSDMKDEWLYRKECRGEQQSPVQQVHPDMFLPDTVCPDSCNKHHGIYKDLDHYMDVTFNGMVFDPVKEKVYYKHVPQGRMMSSGGVSQEHWDSIRPALEEIFGSNQDRGEMAW